MLLPAGPQARLCRAWCHIARRSVSPPHWHARIPYRPTLGVSRIAGKSGCRPEFRYCNWDRLSYRPCNPVPPRALCHLRAPLMKKHRDFILRCPAICFRVFAWTTLRITGDDAQRSVGHWAMLSTKPSPTGSDTITNTIGMLCVSCCSALIAAVERARITSGLVSTICFASDLILLLSPPVHSVSISKFSPSLQPNRRMAA